MINCPTCEFADFDKDKCKRLLTRLPHICHYAKERKPRNRFEKLKSMTMEQMAEFIAKFHGCSRCPGFNVPCDNRCKEYWLDWLKEEVKE